MTSNSVPSQMCAVAARGMALSSDELARSARHLCLPEVGLAGQKRLKAASVLCVGTGGLGSPVLLYLAAAGVGRLGIVDFDVVEASNLNRQVIHGTSSLGKAKTSSARDRILELNPHCDVDVHDVALSSENALEIIGEYDIIVDGTDNFPTRYLVNDACVILGKPNIYGSVQRFEGQASVFNLSAASPNYRDLVPEPPPPGLVPSCAEGGVIGVLPGLVGIIQATETIKIITGVGETLNGRLLLIDALTMKFRELVLKPSPDRKVIDRLIDYQEFCGVAGQADEQADEQAEDKEKVPQLKSLSVQELRQALDGGADDVLLIDVRNPDEAEIASIGGSVLIPLSTIESGEAIEKIRQLAAGRRIFAYCKLGGRSARALICMQRHRIDGVNVEGGIDAWAEHIDPLMNRY